MDNNKRVRLLISLSKVLQSTTSHNFSPVRIMVFKTQKQNKLAQNQRESYQPSPF